MNEVLAGQSNCCAYLDHLVVYTASWTEHMQAWRQVFQCLSQASLTINLAKCEFTINYLGRQVEQGQVRPLEELRSFLEMAGYHRGFCRNFSSAVHPYVFADVLFML